LLSERLHIVKVAEGEKPSATVQRGILTVTYARQGGLSVRPSSLAILRVLQGAF
jgi:hypothetical protein